MAQQLDLQEQEQVDALKAFWAQYGNLIVWVATIVLGAFAAWNGVNYLQRSKAQQASTMYGELEQAAQAADADRAARIFSDMKAQAASFLPKFLLPVPTYTQQAGLLAAKVAADKGKPADATADLQWVADNGNDENVAVAHLRLAGLLADAKKYDDANRQLDQVKGDAFAALVADRRGDIALAKGDREAARKAFQTAWDGMGAKLQYRLLVEAKLTALGAAPAASAASGAAQ